jgi:protein O-GlcNAc transferase
MAIPTLLSPAVDFGSLLTGESRPDSVFRELESALLGYDEDPTSANAKLRVLNAARELAEIVVELPKRETESLIVQRALRSIAALGASGVHDYPISENDRAFLAGKSATQWPVLLAKMLLGSAWQWGDLPELSAVPTWLWGEYTNWVFAQPLGFTAVGDAERYSRFVLTRVEDLARLVQRNTGSAAVRTAAEAYLLRASSVPLYFAQDSLRRFAEARGLILKRIVAREGTPYDPLPFPRAGRRLRVGFLSRHFGSQTETYSTIPTFEQLDAERFEVILFSCHPATNALAEYCRSKVQDYRVLPEDLDAQVATLRDANLDVLVFGTNVTAVVNEVTRLAVYRIAPLQVINNSSCITSGFAEADLYVSGDLTEAPESPSHFTERLGLLPGPAHAFNYSADRQPASTGWTREALSIPADAVVFATGANYFKIVPEMQHTWAKLLAAVPGSRLLIHPFNSNWKSTYPTKRFCAEFDQVLAEYGVSPDRLIVSTMKFPSRADVCELLKVADVYLDTFPFGGVNSLVDPLEIGVPPVAWEGRTFRSRMGAALLRSLELPELIATDEAQYLAINQALAADPRRRAALSEKIHCAMQRVPVFLDTLAASDAFGDLIETAFDEIVAVGRKEFLRQREPLRASTGGADAFDAVTTARQAIRRIPTDAKARHAYGAALLSAGNARRAVDYLLASVQTDEKNGALWFDLAKALRANGQTKDALPALQTSLQLNVKNAAGWAMVADVAQSLGAYDLANEAMGVLRHLESGALDGVDVPQL